MLGDQRSPQSSRIATSRSRRVSLISCSSSTRFSAVAASGAQAKSMTLAGGFVMSETRHRNGCAKAVKSSAAVIGAIDACPK
jgi:hypothetical protein